MKQCKLLVNENTGDRVINPVEYTKIDTYGNFDVYEITYNRVTNILMYFGSTGKYYYPKYISDNGFAEGWEETEYNELT